MQKDNLETWFLVNKTSSHSKYIFKYTCVSCSGVSAQSSPVKINLKYKKNHSMDTEVTTFLTRVFFDCLHAFLSNKINVKKLLPAVMQTDTLNALKHGCYVTGCLSVNVREAEL